MFVLETVAEQICMQTVMSESISMLTSGSSRAAPHCARCGMPTRAHNNILCLQKQLEQLSEMPGFAQFFVALFPSVFAGPPGTIPPASAQPQQASPLGSTSQEGGTLSGSIADTFPKREVEAEANFNPGEDIDNNSEEECLDPPFRKPLVVEPRPLTALTKMRGTGILCGIIPPIAYNTIE
ncbi:hypothetical protein BKA70DRAFT_1241789 [Coprinopsis sp. MPI-PUGE-AT-0042]|nr:hypothetical protein BKA70DRAFT_1241789 [Coprinopsis sp. MPI-PUGE-AT-0042]